MDDLYPIQLDYSFISSTDAIEFGPVWARESLWSILHIRDFLRLRNSNNMTKRIITLQLVWIVTVFRLQCSFKKKKKDLQIIDQ